MGRSGGGRRLPRVRLGARGQSVAIRGGIQCAHEAADDAQVLGGFEDEDMLEMLNAGLLEVIVVDDWKAKMWAQVLPKVKVNEGVAVRSGGKIGWAIRKGSPKLDAAINDFYTNFVKKQGLVEYRFKQYYTRIKQIKDPTGTAESKRFA